MSLACCRRRISSSERERVASPLKFGRVQIPCIRSGDP
jgi:hypothetical protein